MAYPGPSIGPWEIAELDINLVNEVFRQIEEQISILRGLRNTALTAAGVTVSVATHSHDTAAEGGQISHDTALTGVSADDHHAKLHTHNADGSGSLDHGILSGLADDDHTQYLIGNRTDYTDLTDGGSTVLHSHAASGAGEMDNQLYDANATVTRIADELIAGTGVTFTELAEGSGDALQISVDTSSFVTTTDPNWVDLTDGGATTLHSHSGTTAETDQALYDAQSTVSRLADQLLAGSNITLTEYDNSDAITIASTGGGGGLTLVEAKTITSDVQSYTFSGLDGNTDGVYLLICNFLNGASTSLYTWQPNGVTTNQKATRYNNNGVADGLSNQTDLQIGFSILNGFCLTHTTIYARCNPNSVAMVRQYHSHYTNYPATGDCNAGFHGGVWTDNSTNITSIIVTGDQTDSIKNGSQLYLYKLQQS